MENININNNNNNNKERIQKKLANAGVASRRAIETMIKNGEITVNNSPAELGQKISDTDQILIKGKKLDLLKNINSNLNINRTIKHEVLLYHKPTGEICSRSDPNHNNTVFKNLPKLDFGRWIQIGRLDLNTSGLLLFTTDGMLANNLMHPKQQISRVYLTRIFGDLNNIRNAISKLLAGVKLQDGMAKFTDIKLIQKTDSNKNISQNNSKNTWLECELKEGRNREVRRLWESQDFQVNRLIRIEFAGINLPKSIKAGEFNKLSNKQISSLYKQANLKQST